MKHFHIILKKYVGLLLYSGCEPERLGKPHSHSITACGSHRNEPAGTDLIVCDPEAVTCPECLEMILAASRVNLGGA